MVGCVSFAAIPPGGARGLRQVSRGRAPRLAKHPGAGRRREAARERAHPGHAAAAAATAAKTVEKLGAKLRQAVEASLEGRVRGAPLPVQRWPFVLLLFFWALVHRKNKEKWFSFLYLTGNWFLC